MLQMSPVEFTLMLVLAKKLLHGDDVTGLRNGGGAPSLFSRQVPELSPSHIYCQVSCSHNRF